MYAIVATGGKQLKVEEGQIVGYITDYFGNLLKEYYSPVTGKILYNKKEDISFDLFRNAMRNNWVTFDDIGTYYKILNIYNLI